MTRSSLLLGALSTLIALALTTPAFAADANSPNMRHVLNVPYEARNGTKPNAGTDIEFAQQNGRWYAFAGSYMNGMQIFDISQPERTRRVAVYDCGITQGDIQLFRDRGRLYATYTSDTTNDGTSPCNQDAERLGYDMKKPNSTAGKNGTFVVDVTDPRRPRTTSFIEVPQGSHNMTVHPSGDYLYNSNSDLITSIEPAIEVFDVRDPRRPSKVGELELTALPGLGTESHDITFNEAGTRAYSAALSHGAVIDTTDPAAPRIVSEYDDETINVWHQSDPVTIGGREFIIAEDEMYGAAGGPHCPSGGVHVYEVTGELEKAPVKVGYWNIDELRPTSSATGRCTAHVLDIHEDAEIMTIAFYNGGVRVVDLSGLRYAKATSVGLGDNGTVGTMVQTGFYRIEGMDSWSAKTPFVESDGDFYLYGNDQQRGLDVYHYDASATRASNGGEFLSPQQAAEKLGASQLSISAMQERGMYCLLPATDG